MLTVKSASPSFLIIVRVLALSYVNPVTNVSLTSNADNSKSNVEPSFCVNVAVEPFNVAPVVWTSVIQVTSNVEPSLLVNVIVPASST